MKKFKYSLRLQNIPNNKGAFAKLWQAAIGLGIFVLVISLSALMLDEVRSETDVGSVARNVTDHGLEGLDLMGDWTTIIVIAIIMIVIIGLILRELGYLGTERGR